MPQQQDAKFLWRKLRTNFRLAALRIVKLEQAEVKQQLRELRRAQHKTQTEHTDRSTCKVCWDRGINVVCLDCGHQCLCRQCGALMVVCPICMQPITKLVELG